MDLSEDELLDVLKAGTERTRNWMAQRTDYHGGPTTTEYILTADLARALVERHLEVKVECPNKRLLNAWVARKPRAARQKLRSRRTDIAVVDSTQPVALIEVKIGVSSLNKIEGDLKKIVTTISLMKRQFAQKVIGAVVFQTHVGGNTRRTSRADFASAIQKMEQRISKSLSVHEKSSPDFSFSFNPLQEPQEGIVERAVDYMDGGHGEWGEHGHATRYYVVLIKSKVQSFIALHLPAVEGSILRVRIVARQERRYTLSDPRLLLGCSEAPLSNPIMYFIVLVGHGLRPP